jgi:CNT family concentrative nucleoside transporter
MSWLNLGSLCGCVALAVIAWAAGGCKRPVAWRAVGGSTALLAGLGAAVFWLPPTRTVLLWVNDLVIAILDAGSAGSKFVFGPLALNPGDVSASGERSIGYVFAAQALPAVVFFSALMAGLYHLGVMQPLVKLFARLFHRTMGLSGAEALAGSANIFVGVESALVVRPYLETMTRSELMNVIACGMATTASTTLAIYIMFLRESFPLIAGHLISASVISIPAAAMMCKLVLPERESPVTLGKVPPLGEAGREANLMSALASGAWDGLKLAAGIATLLIAILGVVAILDLGLVKLTSPFAPALGGPVDIGRILGWLFAPLAWLLGLESGDLSSAARMLGERAVLTEVVAYRRLGELAAARAISPRGLVVLSYALCGFAHVASIGIFVGGTAAIAPSRRGDLAAVGFKALIAATLATLLTGAIAGVFYHGQASILGL